MTAAQEPRAGEVLTAESVKLLRAGDVIACVGPPLAPVGTKMTVKTVDDEGVDVVDRGEDNSFFFETVAGNFTLVSRPSESSASVDRIGTHSPGCWARGSRHYACAVAEIERLRTQAPACRKCADKGFVEYEGGDGEGWPSRPEVEACECRTQAPAREGEEPEGLGDALADAWTNFLDANPDDLTSPSDLPDHTLVTCDQMRHIVREALAALSRQHQEGEGR